MPIQSSGAAHGDGVELVEHAVLAGEREAHLVELALDVERVRREQLAGRVAAPTAVPSTSIVGIDGRDAVGVHLDGPGAVGDRLDDLDARPTGRTARDMAMAWRPRSMASCTSPG